LVNFSGSAIGLVPESINCEAILQAWYPGEAGGKAIVDVLYGKYNPSGRLPVTFYRNSEQLPDFEDYNMKGRTYRFMTEKPLFPFGFGLSYTHFDYGKVTLNKKVKAGESVKLVIPITNNGSLAGDEVIQVYLKKMNDLDGPVKTLRAFKRVSIEAGERVIVRIELTPEDLVWWDLSTQTMKMHSGDYCLIIGGSSVVENNKPLKLKIY